MRWARFADKSRTKFFEDGIATDQDPPEPIRIFRVVGFVLSVLIEGNRIGNFNRHRPDFYLDAEFRQSLHKHAVEIRDGPRRQLYGCARRMIRLDSQFVIDKVELYFKNSARVRNRRR